MSRFNSSGSYGHHIQRWGVDDYEIGWTVDFYYSDVRGRFPRTFRRFTNEKGAKRFSKKWSVDMPSEPSEARD